MSDTDFGFETADQQIIMEALVPAVPIFDPPDNEHSAWSPYLKQETVKELMSHHHNAHLYFFNVIKNPVHLWLFAMEKVIHPSVSWEEAAQRVKTMYPRADSFEEVKTIVVEELQKCYMRFNFKRVPLTGQLLVAETEPVIMHKKDFESWEVQLFQRYPEIDVFHHECDVLQHYTPKQRSDFITPCWMVKFRGSKAYIRGRLYMDWYRVINTNEKFTTWILSRLLQDLSETHLPSIPWQELEEPVTEVSTRVPEMITLPLKCSMAYFESSQYMDLPPNNNNPEEYRNNIYLSLSVRRRRDQFIESREKNFCYQWLAQPFTIPKQTSVRWISPYAQNIVNVDQEHAIKGGLLIGDAMIGKTFFMLNYSLRKSLEEEKGFTLFLLPPHDYSVVRHALEKSELQYSEEQVGIYWSALDCRGQWKKVMSKQKFIIVNYKFLSRSNQMREALFQIQGSCHRVVVDQFQDIAHRTSLYEFLRDLHVNVLWLVSSRMSTEHSQKAYKFLRLDKTFPGQPWKSGFHPLEAAIFRQLSFRVMYQENHMTIMSNYTSRMFHIPVRPPESYPAAQCHVAISKVLDSGNTRNMSKLMYVLSMLQSSIPLIKRSVDTVLFHYSDSIRAGGSLFVNIPDYEHLPEEVTNLSVLDRCSICMSTSLTHPIRNEACEHVSCYSCLSEWNFMQSACPLCRCSFKPIFHKCVPPKEDVGQKRKRSAEAVEDSESVSTDARIMQNFNLSAKRTKSESVVPTLRPAAAHQMVEEQEMYMDNSRINNLVHVLQQGLYDKVLVLTHWNCLLTYYEKKLKALLPKSIQVGMLPSLIQYTDYDWIDAIVEPSKVVICHARNMNYFRNDGRFEQVILMDTDGSTKSIEIWYNYFRQCKSRVYFSTIQSVGSMFMDVLKDMISKTHWNSSRNVSFPKQSSQDVLIKYQEFIGK